MTVALITSTMHVGKFCIKLFAIAAIGVILAIGLPFMLEDYVFRPNFDEIFNADAVTTKCYGRSNLLRELRITLDAVNPLGLIFVTGRRNSGKTTFIKAAVAERKYVAYINFRLKPIGTADMLIDRLNDAFRISKYKQFIQKFQRFQYLQNIFMINFFFPQVAQENSENDLETVLQQIKDLLKFAKLYKKRTFYQRLFNNKIQDAHISDRPVIIVDELGNLKPLLEKEPGLVEVLLNWFVTVSKDEQLCDVIFASHDGKIMEDMPLKDKGCVTNTFIDSFTLEDIKNVPEWNNRNLNLTLLYNEVRGHAIHVASAIVAENDNDMKNKIADSRNKERQTLNTVLKMDDTFKKYFMAIMKVFDSQISLNVSIDPIIHENVLIRDADAIVEQDNYLFYSNCPDNWEDCRNMDRAMKNKDLQSTIRKAVNLGYLSYNPVVSEYYSRSVLFLMESHFLLNCKLDWERLSQELIELNSQSEYCTSECVSRKIKIKLEQDRLMAHCPGISK